VRIHVLFVLQRGPKRQNSQQAQPRAEARARVQGKHAGTTSPAHCNTDHPRTVLFVCFSFYEAKRCRLQQGLLVSGAKAKPRVPLAAWGLPCCFSVAFVVPIYVVTGYSNCNGRRQGCHNSRWRCTTTRTWPVEASRFAVAWAAEPQTCPWGEFQRCSGRLVRISRPLALPCICMKGPIHCMCPCMAGSDPHCFCFNMLRVRSGNRQLARGHAWTAATDSVARGHAWTAATDSVAEGRTWKGCASVPMHLASCVVAYTC
jgi:hypothetical protein